MCQRIRTLGFTILHVDRPMTGHDLAMTRFSQYWRRAVRSGYAYAEVSTRFRSTDFPLWGNEARRNLDSWRRIARNRRRRSAALDRSALFYSYRGSSAIIALLALRTAMRFRWKTSDLVTLLLFSLHSHLVHIPLDVRSTQISTGSFGWQDSGTDRV